VASFRKSLPRLKVRIYRHSLACHHAILNLSAIVRAVRRERHCLAARSGTELRARTSWLRGICLGALASQ
jgi:hypothetical protein